MFDYIYGNEGEQYQFLQLPYMMVFEEKFHELSGDAKILYSVLFDRVKISVKNKWIDENGRAFIYYKIEDICNNLGHSTQKAVKIMQELSDFGLIETKRQGQGRPSKIFVKHFARSNENSEKSNKTNKGLSETAQDLFKELLELSKSAHKEKWIYENDTPYVVYKNLDICNKYKCNTQKAVQLIQELRNFDLVETKRQGQGKPNRIYIKLFQHEQAKNEELLNFEIQNSKISPVQNFEIQNSETLNFKKQECRNSKLSLYNNQNHIFKRSESYQSNLSETNCKPKSESTFEISAPDRIDKIDFSTTLSNVKDQIEYNCLLDSYDKSQINEIAELITWCMCTPEQTLKINGTNIDIALVRSKCEELNSEHIIYILDCLQANTTEIKNRRNYLLTCIYNAPTTMEGYYASKVQHDMYGN